MRFAIKKMGKTDKVDALLAIVDAGERLFVTNQSTWRFAKPDNSNPLMVPATLLLKLAKFEAQFLALLLPPMQVSFCS